MLISKEELQSKIADEIGKCHIKAFDTSVNVILQLIRNMPAADVQLIEHSKWICVNDDENVYMCDKCGGEVIFIEGNPTNNEYAYCMYCGAKMDKS